MLGCIAVTDEEIEEICRLVRTARRSKLRPDGREQEALLTRRSCQAVVECHDFERGRPSFRHDECRGELQRIGGPKRMDAQKSNSGLANRLDRLYFVPALGEMPQAVKDLVDERRIQIPIPFE